MQNLKRELIKKKRQKKKEKKPGLGIDYKGGGGAQDKSQQTLYLSIKMEESPIFTIFSRSATQRDSVP